MANGIGRVVWTGSRAVYEGEFKRGKREGWGRFYIKGERYEGEWREDRKHGALSIFAFGVWCLCNRVNCLN